MSTAQSVRYLLSAGAAFVGIGMMINGAVLTGVFFLLTAVLLLPILYRLLYIDSYEVQLLSPVVFLTVAIFSLAMYIAIPKPYTIPPKVVYSDTAVQTVVTSSAETTTLTTVTTQALTSATQAVVHDDSVVYRTPSGSRYHLNADCGGENSYEISQEDAVEAGLTPCKKCFSD